MNNILRRALISEKSFGRAEENKYTFIVEKSADKEEIGKSCKELFGVTVFDVNTANYKGKIKKSRGKGLGKRSDFKKAIITLKAGEKIDLFEVEKAEEDEKKKKDSSKK